MSPINPDALSAEPAPAEAPAKPAAKRSRRTKAELIADARIPADDEMIEVKFESTGTKAERDWPTAAALFRDGKVEFVDKTLKYSVMKIDQGADTTSERPPDAVDDLNGLINRWSEIQARLDELSPDGETQLEYETLIEEAALVRKQIIDAGGTDPESDDGYAERNQAAKPVMPPEGAEVGDEVRLDGDISYVGYGLEMTQIRPVKPGADERVICARRWEWTDDGWEAHKLQDAALAAKQAKPAAKKSPAKAAPQVEREVVSDKIEQISLNVWRVTGGYLETVGLPDYSNLKIGPTSASHEVADDGRRTEVKMGDRTVSLPTAVIEAQQECFQVCEYVMRAERYAMISFLESCKPGSTQPRS